MDNQREPMTPFDKLVIAAMLGYGLTVTLGALWLLWIGAQWLYSQPYGDTFCGSIIVLLIAVVAISSTRST